MIREALEKLNKKQNLSEKETEAVFTEIMTGLVQTDTIASFLLALKTKKESVDEITAASRVLRKFATRINAKDGHLLDTCGTGGDDKHTFNISTISAFVACGAGATVAKHGNRAVSSRCGSADLLEALGVKVDVEKGLVERCLNEIGIGFLFAQKLHLAMKYAMPARKIIKTRSIFNILGPLTNPAGAKFQLLGVYDSSLVETLANVLRNLGSIRAMVVHGKDGLDEITTACETEAAELKDNAIKKYKIRPEDFGFPRPGKEDLKGGDAAFNAKIAMDILNGEDGPKRDVVILNAAAAIYIVGIASSLKEGIKKCEDSIDSGRALEKLEKLKELTSKQ